MTRQWICGARVVLAFILAGGAGAAQTGNNRGVTASQPRAAAADHGKYYALCVGINAYRSLPKLRTAVADAESVGAELQQRYGFAVQVLRDPDRQHLLTALNGYRKLLGSNDAFLVYYAGHGHFDPSLGKGYWLPADAQNDDPTNWIISDEITADIRSLSARQALVVSDSCYSGMLSRAGSINLDAARAQADRTAFLASVQSRKSRQLLSSGGNEPVSDGGGDGTHSIFASVLLQSLREMPFDRFTVDELFNSYIRVRVGGRSQQLPEINALQNSGHDGGSFVFERTGAAPLPPVARGVSAPPAAMPGPNPAGDRGGERTVAEGSATAPSGCDTAAIRAQVAQEPNNESLLARLAQCAYQVESYADSIRAWNQLIALNDGNASYFEGRGLAKLKSDAIAGARQDFDAATKKDATNGQYWADLAQANEELDNSQETARCFYKAIQLGAKSKENYLGLARAYEKTGNHDLANEMVALAGKMK